MQQFEVPQGAFEVRRHPPASDRSLQAWDAADTYLLEHVAQQDLGGRTLVANDRFGALAVALVSVGHQVTSWGDSLLSHEAARGNLVANGLEVGACTMVPSTQEPPGSFDLVLVRVPRENSLLEQQVRQLRPVVESGATVVAAAMTKHVHTSTIRTFEAAIGPTPTSLAKRKARLLLPELDPSLEPGPAAEPRRWTHDGITTVNHAGVFSGRHLDQGTRVLLAHLPVLDVGTEALDLGCGNGLVGAVLARSPRVESVTFTDDSHLAVASARATMELNHPGRRARFLVTDAADDVPTASLDVVVCNPPFHGQGVRSTDVAWRMIQGAHRVLRPGGTLTLVGNRQLEHHRRCASAFGNAEVVSSHPKFVVVRSTR